MDYRNLIYNYLRKYQLDPTSRVFAPLAEAYRKAGLVDEAIEIATEGLKLHPHFIGGRVALARALFDKQRFEEVVNELAPLALDHPDNLVAQRLLAESYLMLNRTTDALTAYKMLLYFAPQDPEARKIVQELETRSYEKGQLTLRKDNTQPNLFNIKTADQAIQTAPEKIRARRNQKIERLQKLLQKVERYRTLREMQKPGD